MPGLQPEPDVIGQYYEGKYARGDEYVAINRDPLHYHQTLLHIVSALGPLDNVLDVGCSTGYLGQEIKRRTGARLSGIEISPSAVAQAKQLLDDVVAGDIQHAALPWPAGSFDLIVCGDVLEHLFDPLAVLKRLRPLLADGGSLIATMPNVAYWRLRMAHLFGRWEYEDKGIMERGHIRFFTRKTGVELIESAGFTMESVRAWVPVGPTWRLRDWAPTRACLLALNRVLPTWCGHSLVYHARNIQAR